MTFSGCGSRVDTQLAMSCGCLAVHISAVLLSRQELMNILHLRLLSSAAASLCSLESSERECACVWAMSCVPEGCTLWSSSESGAGGKLETVMLRIRAIFRDCWLPCAKTWVAVLQTQFHIQLQPLQQHAFVDVKSTIWVVPNSSCESKALWHISLRLLPPSGWMSGGNGSKKVTFGHVLVTMEVSPLYVT